MISKDWDIVVLTKDLVDTEKEIKKQIGKGKRIIIGPAKKFGALLAGEKPETEAKILVVFKNRVPDGFIGDLDKPSRLDLAMDELRQAATAFCCRGRTGKVIFSLPPNLGLASYELLKGIFEFPDLYSDYRVALITSEWDLPSGNSHFTICAESRRKNDCYQVWLGLISQSNPHRLDKNYELTFNLIGRSAVKEDIKSLSFEGWIIFELEKGEWFFEFKHPKYSTTYYLTVIL